ncbi:MAG: bifunctional metallophosphatase/5'-nucleotidase [Clostridia bacterium]|nr:bifunctional metallophosphatase/5'-nucleotidase [Clostridia bacterium]
MKKRIFASIVCFAMICSILTSAVFAVKNTEDIVIIYENDVHCAVDGYSKISALKNELKQTYENVGVVSSGDYVQGTSLGAVSKGEYIVNLMNLVGYDAVGLGNHEFDFRISRLDELVDIMNTKPICCNFQKIGQDETYFKPYSIVSYGEVDIAYIGVITPGTISSSSPAQFKDENGDFIFTFNPLDLYSIVQRNIDSAIAEGADYVIALSHLGDLEPTHSVLELIENVSGLDIVLDGHSHSVIENRLVEDKLGNNVVLTSTGTKFQNIGKLTISSDSITTELISTDKYNNTDPAVDAYIKQINDEYSQIGNRKIAYSQYDLITHDKDGNRLVRNAETNLGDLCADAFRVIADADIGYVNGGGIRSDIKAGDITFNDILSVFPFNNQLVVSELSGQTIKDMLEMSVMNWPIEDGSFPHVSGITFSVDKSIPSSVTIDENAFFTGVDGEYRVYDIKILDKKSGEYKPIELDKKYTFASHNYYLLEYGSGMAMLADGTVIRNDGTLDVEVLEKYILEELSGVVGEQYKEMSQNVFFTDGKNEDNPQMSDSNISLLVITSLISLAGVIYISKKQHFSRSFLYI